MRSTGQACRWLPSGAASPTRAGRRRATTANRSRRCPMCWSRPRLSLLAMKPCAASVASFKRVKGTSTHAPTTRVERWLRDAYPTQEVHDRVEWHAEGSMTQCFVRLDDRVVLIHLVGEGDRTVLKGRLEIRSILKPGSTQATPSPRAGIRFRHRTNEVTFSNRAGRAPNTDALGGALAHRNARRHDATTHPDPATFRIACSLTRSQSNSRRPAWNLQRRSCTRSAHPRTVRG